MEMEMPWASTVCHLLKAPCPSRRSLAPALTGMPVVPEGEVQDNGASGPTEDIQGVLDDLRDKEVELKEVIAQNASTKEVIKVSTHPVSAASSGMSFGSQGVSTYFSVTWSVSQHVSATMIGFYKPCGH